MVVREHQPGEPSGRLCIAQTQHAEISGQLALAWGNESFPPPEARAECCVAAARHDDGMGAFDSDPELDPETGLPRSFMRMPLDLWLECWRRGPEVVGADEPYAGILVSLHGEHLLGYRRIDDEDEEAQRAVAEWRRGQRELRERLRAECERDKAIADLLDPETVERGRKLVEVWDAMSLAVCMPRLPDRFESIPAGEGTAELRMRETPGGQDLIEVDPWPFGAPRVPLAASGRRLEGGYRTRDGLREALAAAPIETLSLTLAPREESPGTLPDPAIG